MSFLTKTCSWSYVPIGMVITIGIVKKYLFFGPKFPVLIFSDMEDYKEDFEKFTVKINGKLYKELSQEEIEPDQGILIKHELKEGDKMILGYAGGKLADGRITSRGGFLFTFNGKTFVRA